MNPLDTLLSALTLLIAGIAAGIAVAQLRAGHRDAHASRVADLAWQIYQAYEDQTIRNARKAIEVVSNRFPIPQSGEEYGKTYVLEDTHLRNQLTEEIGEQPTAAVRRMLRFYHQIGILIDKGLVDSDFVFALIGPGLVTSKHGIVVTCDWYQNHWAGSTGHEKGPCRPIYANALKLCEHYENWAKRNQRVL